MTAAQQRLLIELSDTQYQFLGRLESTGNVLKQLGYAESDLRLRSKDFKTGITRFHIAYRRTEAGRIAAEKLQKGEVTP